MSLRRIVFVVAILSLHHGLNRVSSGSLNPMIKDFEEERKTYIEDDHKYLLEKLDNAMRENSHDPGLGFPVVTPKGLEKKILRHILIFNRLSPPNSLRGAEISAKYEFTAWLDNSPGRGCSIELTLRGIQNVWFPDKKLNAKKRSVDRDDITSIDFSALKKTITLKWDGLLKVKRLRMDIPVIIDKDAREDDVAEFAVLNVVYKGAYEGSYDYEAWAKPMTIRWKVGPPPPVKITVNNGKPIKMAVPDGRRRKFKIKVHNKLVADNEYIQVFIAPLIEDLEGDPFSFYYGMDFKEKRLMDPFRRKWKYLRRKRGDGRVSPYFEHQRYWPYVLCEHIEVVPRDEPTLADIARAIPDIRDVWADTEENMMSFRTGQQLIDPFGHKIRREMQKLVRKKVCLDGSAKYKIKICSGPEGDGPSPQQRDSKRCGVWPKEFQVLSTEKNGGKHTIRYRIHPIVEEKTPITLMFGYFAGILEGKEPRFNERFRRTTDSRSWLKNQFLFVSTKSESKHLLLKCKNDAGIGEERCCRVKTPMSFFHSNRHEKNFDLIVFTTQPDKLLIKSARWPSSGASQRLRFRKSGFGRGDPLAMLASRKRFCYEPKAYGKFQIQFAIVEACPIIFKIDDCMGVGQTAKEKTFGQDKQNVLPPSDFTVPPPFTVFAPPVPMGQIKIRVMGRGQGDVVQVTNGEWFEIRVSFQKDIMGDVTLKAMSPKLEFDPTSADKADENDGWGGVHGVLSFHSGDSGRGKWLARAEVDCPSPTKIVVINYQLAVDELMAWALPKANFIQIAPNPQDVAMGNDENLNDSVLCDIPEDYCFSRDVICGTPTQIAEEVLCEKYPDLKDCGGGVPERRDPDDDLLSPDFKLLSIIAMYAAAAIMVFMVIYRNCCGRDGAALKALKDQMKELEDSVKAPKLPEDAVDAAEFLELAGFDGDDVFSRENPNPVIVAQAQMSMQKMLSAVKSR